MDAKETLFGTRQFSVWQSCYRTLLPMSCKFASPMSCKFVRGNMGKTGVPPLASSQYTPPVVMVIDIRLILWNRGFPDSLSSKEHMF